MSLAFLMLSCKITNICRKPASDTVPTVNESVRSLHLTQFERTLNDFFLSFRQCLIKSSKLCMIVILFRVSRFILCLVTLTLASYTAKYWPQYEIPITIVYLLKYALFLLSHLVCLIKSMSFLSQTDCSMFVYCICNCWNLSTILSGPYFHHVPTVTYCLL